ncbi:MAG: MFS transporter [Acidobacteria bacterium]|nr:MFS transporter [Acidobacteriota bacterium]
MLRLRRVQGWILSMTRCRWVVVALLFLATTINYIDRAVLGVLKPLLEEELGWTQVDYGWIVTAFQITYALGYISAGRLFDTIGVRVGYFLSVSLWSLAAMAHAAVRSVWGFSLARAGLGLAEGGNFPAAIKAVTEWFPKEERAFATGVFNAGSNVGAVACPLVVPWLANRWGWQAAFVATGSIGFAWVLLWVILYRQPEEHPWVSAEELAHIRKDPPDPPAKIPWLLLLGYRQTWAFVVGMAASAPVWWFYIYWIPDFLNKQYHVTLTQSSGPLIAIFLIADGGGIAGGWLSSRLIRQGWSVNAARKTALLACALCVVPVFLTPLAGDLWLSVALVALAASAHCGFAANLFTLVSDTIPRKAVSSVVGIGGMAGAVAGMFSAQLIGRVLHYTHNSYIVPFALASAIYLLAVAVIHALVPKLEQMEL